MRHVAEDRDEVVLEWLQMAPTRGKTFILQTLSGRALRRPSSSTRTRGDFDDWGKSLDDWHVTSWRMCTRIQ